MIEHVVSALVAALLLGLVANQVTCIIQKGTLFAPLRIGVFNWQRKQPPPHKIEKISWREYLYDGFTCHLCLGQWIAFLVTWGAVAIGLAVDSDALPWQAWVFLATAGSFAVGGVEQLIEMFRGENI